MQKLKLNRETLRELNIASMRRVAGALTPVVNTLPVTDCLQQRSLPPSACAGDCHTLRCTPD